MAVDYDLVVIGSSWEGIYAAKKAVQLQARVALVTQCDAQSNTNYLPNDILINQSLREAGCLNYYLENNLFAPKLTTTSATQSPHISLGEAGNWSQGVSSVMQAHNSLSSLAALGVDIIPGQGEFYRLPKLGFVVANKQLRSRSFLLATGSNYVAESTGSPYAAQLTSVNLSGYLTPQDLAPENLAELPHRLIIVGSGATAIELAQTLVRFNKDITLLIPQTRMSELSRIVCRLLPLEDLDVAMLIQAQLEAEGIKILTNLEAIQIKTIKGQKWLQAGDRALSADEIIVTADRRPNIAGLNLKGVNVRSDFERVWVNDKLQTTNPRIYACGDLSHPCTGLSEESSNNIAVTQYHVNLILKNALFMPYFKKNHQHYNCLPNVVLTQPNIARIGLGEDLARLYYVHNFYVVKQYFHNLAQAQISDRTTGMCKLLVRENGTILGCSLVADNAGELITVVAMMMKYKIKLDSNPMRGLTSCSIPAIYPSMTEILQQASESFYQQKLQRNPKLIKRLRTWFSLRKAWHK